MTFSTNIEEDHEDEELILCPECEGEVKYMGILGSHQYFRCIYCGIEFSRKVEKDN